MSVSTSNTTNGIEIRLATYHNCDDVQLFWRAVVDGEDDAPAPDCLGRGSLSAAIRHTHS